MKRVLCLTLALLSFIPAVLRAQEPAAPQEGLNTVMQKASYIIGRQFGADIKSNLPNVDVKALLEGINEAIEGKPSQLTEEQIQATRVELQKVMIAEQMKMAEADKKKGLDFLAENAKKPNVKTTKSGLQYIVEKEGTGAMPKETDDVVCHYKGELIDGTVFDSSYERGEPARFPVNGVIQGWQEALQLMKQGAKWKLFIPSELAYGERGNPAIPPNSVLVFDIELLEVLPPAANK
ncbi:FKBP-type peptidyl-prolyl cis-trans isomerase [Blastopirellula sp. JC732]|uniref:Peptidyl-prolyl cis-trans isomerase n=2 Tax=Blastopirellula sediminis TaxID=2894196 RepID=A0A9X1MHR6_9BACT|nr:FKBP-type peptidyl-prolyl cis-trans isomerase [Blastopirellula sediminis]MCC9607869.1 FKBP-type peptidyl-prolyl cis-trans isomerase [Blastopirellula sediminis]MCC9627338.1 FKBP-type peptidyl-prolyl cis-trans isomerase [Blastopirellula sediminis]